MEFSFPFFLSFLTVCTATRVTHASNPVHAILFLICTFLNSAMLVFTLGLDFFALIYVVIYVGALAILFRFIVMTMNLKKHRLAVPLRYHLTFSALLGSALRRPLVWLFFNQASPFPERAPLIIGDWFVSAERSVTLVVLGSILYTEYFFAFIVAGRILFVGMVGAIRLTESAVSTHPRQQQIGRQLHRTPQLSIFKASDFRL